MLNIHWKDWCWGWNSNNLATSSEELTPWRRPWCWEGLGAEGEGDDRGWDGWMASPTRWTWVWLNSGSWWWTGRPGVLRFMGSQRGGHDWATELHWTLSLSPVSHSSSILTPCFLLNILYMLIQSMCSSSSFCLGATLITIHLTKSLSPFNISFFLIFSSQWVLSWTPYLEQ